MEATTTFFVHIKKMLKYIITLCYTDNFQSQKYTK
jgi:hypothetical protein